VKLALSIAGTAVGLLLGFATAVWEVFLSPLYAGRVPLPVAPVLAILTNAGLVWFTYFLTGRRGLALLPGVVWFATMLVGATKTGEGDLPIPGNDWMGLFAVMLGALAWGVAAYWLLLRPSTRPPEPPVAPPPANAKARAPKPGSRPAGSRPAGPRSAGSAKGRRNRGGGA
jgi:hypothetical protein